MTLKSFQVTFPHAHTAPVVQIDQPDELSAALRGLGLTRPRATLVLVGGAAGLGRDMQWRLDQLFIEVLAPLAQSLDAYVVDGATDSGVIQLMGRAREKIGARFPLIGVAAVGTVRLPGAAPTERDTWQLEPHHTHFILVPGATWGDEAPWLARAAHLLADTAPSLTVLVNGGEVAWRDAEESVKDGRAVVVFAGSGRTADILAAAARGDRSNERANRLANTGLLQVVDLEAAADAQRRLIEGILFQGAKNGEPGGHVQ